MSGSSGRLIRGNPEFYRDRLRQPASANAVPGKCRKVAAMQGLHLTADLHGCHCDSRWLLDAQALGRACIDAVDAAGLQAVAELFHTFPATGHGPGGVTATVLLAESHLCVHTWPEQRAVTLDVYVCNFGGDHSAKAQALLDALVALFLPAHIERKALQRGAVRCLPAAV